MITLTKAIEILDLNVKEVGEKMPADTLLAVKLGSFALKRINAMRSYNIKEALRPLPWEESIEDPGLSDDRIKMLKENPLASPEM